MTGGGTAAQAGAAESAADLSAAQQRPKQTQDASMTLGYARRFSYDCNIREHDRPAPLTQFGATSRPLSRPGFDGEQTSPRRVPGIVAEGNWGNWLHGTFIGTVISATAFFSY